MEQILKQIHELLKSKGIWAEVSQYLDLPVIQVEIEMGDWSHDHLYCDSIMKGEGYSKVSEEEIGNSLEDVYSSYHYYVKSI